MIPETIQFTSDWRSSLERLSEGRKTVMIVTERMRSIVGSDWSGDVSILHTPDGEAQKSWEVVEFLARELEALSFPRDGLLVGIGGGATTDLTGFVASIWMRGVDWIALPTTLAGMVDAAIGGKTGINGRDTKNLVGSFHLPIATIIDTQLLVTLPKRDVSAGIAEILKCGFIADRVILDIAGSAQALDSQTMPVNLELTEMVKRAVSVKEGIVSRDLKEHGERAILNYGHTVGHALERASNYTLRHGEAVSIGMVFAACLSKVVNGLSDDLVQLHIDILRKYELPTAFPQVEFDSLIDLIWRDKKVKAGTLRFITLRAVADPIVVEVVESQLRQAYEEHVRITGEGR